MGKELNLNAKIPRREFLNLLGKSTVAGGGLLLLNACGIYFSSKPDVITPPIPAKTPTIEPTEQNEYSSEHERLNNIINSLPNTRYKALLVEKVGPILDNPNETISLDVEGVSLAINGLEIVRSTQQTNEIYGNFRSIGNPEKVKSYFPTEEQTLKIPLVYLVTPREKEKYPANIASDGTLFAEFTFSTTNPLHEAIAPVISIVTIDPAIRKPEYKEIHTFLENFVYLKEACGLLIYMLTFEDTVKKMHELGFEIHLDVVDMHGKQTKAQGISRAINVLAANEGRLLALHDIGSYMLAAKALGDNLNLQYFPEYQRNLFQFMKVAPMHSPSPILGETYKNILSLDPEDLSRTLHYKGDLNRIP